MDKNKKKTKIKKSLWEISEIIGKMLAYPFYWVMLGMFYFGLSCYLLIDMLNKKFDNKKTKKNGNGNTTK